jgi:hypothetical protein
LGGFFLLLLWYLLLTKNSFEFASPNANIQDGQAKNHNYKAKGTLGSIIPQSNVKH